jgi:hypothetical protein
MTTLRRKRALIRPPPSDLLISVQSKQTERSYHFSINLLWILPVGARGNSAAERMTSRTGS